jgi:hypothetical protein
LKHRRQALVERQTGYIDFFDPAGLVGYVQNIQRHARGSRQQREAAAKPQVPIQHMLGSVSSAWASARRSIHHNRPLG